ncbi:hypothetical protein GCM10027589_09320 [Actinocorallia lasiicapitis]
MSLRHFERALARLRSGDVQDRQSAFDFLREHADSYAEPLLAEFAAEADPELRQWLLELVVESHSPAAIPTLIAHLTDPDPRIRLWSTRALETFDTPVTRQALATTPDP